VAPGIAAAWDGRRLVADTGRAGAQVVLELDGARFATAPATATGSAAFDLPFLPSGRNRIAARLHAGDDDGATSEPFGLEAGRPGLVATPPASPLAPLASQVLVPFGADCAAAEVVVVIPVYNAAGLAMRCIDAVLAHTRGRFRVVVIDDGSPEPDVAAGLGRYRGDPRVLLLRNERNRGFTATANRGIAEAGRADVVLLNADAEVGPNWLTGLRRAAASRSDVGTVTAVSDNAGAFSVPELERENPWPGCWGFADACRALCHDAGTLYPSMPTGNGFCLYVRRAALDAVGALDEDAFPEGYGEENDFCQRAQAAGFVDLVAGNVLVAHARSRSFGHERRETLGRAGMAILRERWPRYEADVGAALHSFERHVLDWRVRRIYAGARADAMPRERVLTIGGNADSGGGGAYATLRRDADRWALHVGDALVDAWHDEGDILARGIWDALQVHAIERIVAPAHAPPSLRDIAGALAIPVDAPDREGMP
jgi:GT2 family glycosyltransferase